MAVLIASGAQLYRTASTFDWNAAYTVLFWYRLNSTGGFYPTVFGMHGSDENSIYEWWGQTENTTNFATDTGGGSSGEFVSNMGLSVTEDVWAHVGIVRQSTTILKIAVNGALSGTSNTGNTSGRASMTRMQWGSYLASSINQNNADYAHIKIWEGVALTADEIAAEMRIIRPVRLDSLWAWYPVFSGSAERVKDYSGNGRDLSEIATVSEALEPGISYGAPVWVVGNVAAGGGDVAITVALGQLSLTGLDATVALSGTANLAVDLGALALAGLAATVAPTGTANIAVETGALALAGLDATVAISGDAPIAIDAGALTLTGLSATVAASGDVAIVVALGQLSLTGLDVTVDAPAGLTVDIDLGALTLTGLAVTVAVSGTANVQIDLGALVLQGLDAAIVAAGAVNVAVDTGTLALTGLPATVEVGATEIAIEAGQLSLTGLPVTVAVSGNVAVGIDIGLLILAGLRATIMAGTIVTPAERIFVVAAENRVWTVEAENRVWTVEAENRIYIAR